MGDTARSAKKRWFEMLRTPLAALGILIVLSVPMEVQAAENVTRIGLLSPEGPNSNNVGAFRERLREHGYVEGRNIEIEYRWAAGHFDRLPGLAADLVSLRVDVIVAFVTQASLAAKAATTTIPIVMVGVADPVGVRLVDSLARPGGNVTGNSSMAAELVGKQLQLLEQVVPPASPLAVLWNPANSVFQHLQLSEAENAGRASGVQLHVVQASAPNDIDAAFVDLKQAGTGGLLILVDPLFGAQYKMLATLALENRIATMMASDNFVKGGGLMAYGPSYFDLYRRAADYVNKIIKGARPADLPVEQPTKFDFLINLNTAKALQLTIPPQIVALADEVIE